ncbi:MAG: class aldolase/adducin family protein, partial [Solirubrobacterales bacterium]|nr:class aldolase/adducin family protein [Solirubrobacterales bacterium]
GSARAVLLGAHGVLATGATPADALLVAEVVEHQAQVAWLLAGRARPGSDEGSGPDHMHRGAILSGCRLPPPLPPSRRPRRPTTP